MPKFFHVDFDKKTNKKKHAQIKKNNDKQQM